MNITLPAIALAFTTCINFFVACYVLLAGLRNKVNYFFFIFLIQVVVWNAINFFSYTLVDPKYILLFTQLALASVLFIPTTFLFFINSFIKRQLAWYHTYILFMLPVGMLLFTFTPHNIAGFAGEVSGYNFIPGPLYFIYIFFFILIISYSLYSLMCFAKTTQNNYQKNQIRLILVGMSISSMIAICTNAIMPVLGLHYVNVYGTAASIFFSICTAYAITRHRLFDIRIILRRGLINTLVTAISICFAVIGAGTVVYTIVHLYQLTGLETILIFAATLFPLQLICTMFAQRYLRRLDVYEQAGAVDLSIPEELQFMHFTQRDLTKINTYIKTTLQKDFQVEQVTFMVYFWQQQLFQSIAHEPVLQLPKYHALGQLGREEPSLFIMGEPSNHFQKLTLSLKHEITEFMNSYHFAAIMPLRTQHELYGFLCIPKSSFVKSSLYVTHESEEFQVFCKKLSNMLEGIMIRDKVVVVPYLEMQKQQTAEEKI